MNGGLQAYRGVVVHEVRSEPKIALRDDFEWVSPEFRAELNGWLRERFGCNGPLRDGELVQAGGKLFATRQTIERIMQSARPAGVHVIARFIGE